MEWGLSGRTAVVTGGGRGLGKAIALEFARSGAAVCIGDIAAREAAAAAEEIKVLGVAGDWLETDVADPEHMEALMERAMRLTGKLDILVSVAGIVINDPFLDGSADGIRRAMDINILGLINAGQSALRRMMPERSGRIVNIASVAGRIGCGERHPFYSMTKAAALNITQTMAKVAAPYNINVNAVCPGIIMTDMWKSILEYRHEETGRSREDIWREATQERILLGRPQEPIDIANAVLFFCSEGGRNITGQALNVCGGIQLN